MSPSSPASSVAHVPVRLDWLAKRKEAALEPALPIVDPHHHLWSREASPYFLPDLLADTGNGHNIVATVFVDCQSMYRADGPPELRSLGETEFANGVAAISASGGYGPTRACAGIVGHVDLRLGGRAKGILERHMQAAGPRFCGIRHIAAWHPVVVGSAHPAEPGLLADAKFREGFATLAPLGLTFDSWLYHTQHDEMLDVAKAFPDTAIVINHIGGAINIGPYAGKRQEVFETWRASMRKLAECPNVVVKLGGLGMRIAGFDHHEQPEPPSSEQLAKEWKPYMEALIEAYGVDRCMFESNLPVDRLSVSYPVLRNAFKDGGGLLRR